jgi:aminoglycoside/choline kinase family phosphotransferase
MSDGSLLPDFSAAHHALRGAGFAARSIAPLPGDVSPRQYARVELERGAGAILALYPEAIREVCGRFLRTTALLAGAGVRVPEILAADCDAGWMLVEDLGPETLGDRRDRPWPRLAPRFADAQRIVRRIAKLPADEVAALSPVLDGAVLRRELMQTWELFLVPQGLLADEALAADLAAVLDELCAKIAIDPAVPCHRDFMARNLIPLGADEDPEARVAVLDHQDLRMGPPMYDLASLFNDTIFPPAAVEDETLEVLSASERTVFHRTAAQRTLKAVGTYASFAQRGATRHLPLIPATLASCLRHLGQVPESHALVDDLARAWSPALQAFPRSTS